MKSPGDGMRAFLPQQGSAFLTFLRPPLFKNIDLALCPEAERNKTLMHKYVVKFLKYALTLVKYTFCIREKK